MAAPHAGMQGADAGATGGAVGGAGAAATSRTAWQVSACVDDDDDDDDDDDVDDDDDDDDDDQAGGGMCTIGLEELLDYEVQVSAGRSPTLSKPHTPLLNAWDVIHPLLLHSLYCAECLV